MDSQWFNQAATKMNGHDYNNAGNKIDLNLKLGLPNSTDHENQYLEFDQMTPHHPNVDINALYSHEGMNHYKLVNEGMNMVNVGQSFNHNEVAWPPSNLMGRQSQYSHAHAEAQAQYMPSNKNYGFISPSPPPHIYHPHNNNFNINQQLAASTPAVGGGATNDYTILDVPLRRADRELGAAGASARRRAAAGMRRPRGGTFIDPYKRCTNYNCNTNDTPMWRRGPLGPKTLCNACGIKYRKEEEKRTKAKEEADRSSSQNPNPENV